MARQGETNNMDTENKTIDNQQIIRRRIIMTPKRKT